MLATLNLQLSPVELLDGHALTPVSPAPGESGVEASGFADLLRLRVDAALTAGELLPEGGSELPMVTELGPTELLRTTDIDSSLVELPQAYREVSAEQEGTDLPGDAVDLILESPVMYPPATAGAGDPTEALALLPIPAAVPLQPTPDPQRAKPEAGLGSQPGGALSRPRSLNSGPRAPVLPPLIDGIEGRAQIPGAEATVLATAGLNLRERGAAGERMSRAAAIAVPNASLDPDNRTSLAKFARRLGPAPTQRNEPLADGLHRSISVAQAAHNLPAPAGPPTGQPTLLPSAASTPSIELSYAAATQPGSDAIGTSVRDRAWGEQLGERVVMMASNQLKQAEIRLTPAELGPLRVQVAIDDGNAHVTFHAQHAVTREALEQALPRLREMLAENGLSLGQADVSDRGVADGGRDQEAANGSVGQVSDDMTEAELDTGNDHVRHATTSNGLLDTFV